MRSVSLVTALAVVLLLAGCTVKLVSDYDEQIDQGVTALQRKTEAILSKMENSLEDPSKTYVASDYDDIKASLNLLRVRAQSMEKDDLTVNQLYLLGYALLDNPPQPASPSEGPAHPADLESLQSRQRKKEALSPEDMRDLRSLLEVSYRAILRLELAKKRGDS